MDLQTKNQIIFWGNYLEADRYIIGKNIRL